ncbi:50S ribosomal protein L11 methyltransferase, partial [Acinetobacter baumannii]
ENVAVNACKKIDIALVDSIGDLQKYDIILANINRHIIEANQKALFHQLNSNGSLVLSGLLESDEEDIKKIFISYNLTHKR